MRRNSDSTSKPGRRSTWGIIDAPLGGDLIEFYTART